MKLHYSEGFHGFTGHRFITDQHDDQLGVGWLAQSVEYCSSIAEVMGSNPVQA